MHTRKLLDETVVFETELKDGDHVTKGQLMGVVKGDIRALLSARTLQTIMPLKDKWIILL